MLEKLKQLKQFKDVQDSLKSEKIEAEKSGVKIVMNGKMDVEAVQLNPALTQREQEEALKDCINGAMKKAQTAAFQKISQMPGFGL